MRVTGPFTGAKLAILVGDRLVAILRDDIATIPFPNHWDLPGGGREGDETPVETVLRETQEEIGISFAPGDLIWSEAYPVDAATEWLFVTEQPHFTPDQVRFGNEGQYWRLVTIDWFLCKARAVPHQPGRLRNYVAVRGRQE